MPSYARRCPHRAIVEPNQDGCLGHTGEGLPIAFTYGCAPFFSLILWSSGTQGARSLRTGALPSVVLLDGPYPSYVSPRIGMDCLSITTMSDLLYHSCARNRPGPPLSTK